MMMISRAVAAAEASVGVAVAVAVMVLISRMINKMIKTIPQLKGARLLMLKTRVKMVKTVSKSHVAVAAKRLMLM